jgi:Flp pilus assembly protein TadD
MRRLAAALLLVGSLAQAQDDWSLTRSALPVGPSAVQREQAGARALALAGRHDEAAQAFAEIARKSRTLRVALLRESARELLQAGRAEEALQTLAKLPSRGDELEREAYRRAGRGRELAERDERAGRWSQAAASWELAGDDARALADYTRAHDDAARLRLLRKLGRELEAERLASAWLARREAAAPLVALAESKRAAGRRDEALALLAQHARSRSPAIHRALRELYAAWGERELAERELTTLVELEPHEPAHRLALADAALARGERERAATELLRVAALDGSAAREAHAAALLADHDLLLEALAHVELARKRAPQELEYAVLEASLLERAGRATDAERAYRALLSTAYASQARAHLAGLWRRMGALDVHIAELRAKDDLDSARLLVELYGRDPRQAEAQRSLLRAILAREPNDRAALLSLERALRDAGELHAALEVAARALDREHLEEVLELARAAPRDPMVPQLLERASALEPSSGVLAEAAAIYGQRGDLPSARAAYQRALALEPSADEVRLAWAELDPAASDQLRGLIERSQSESVVLRAAALLGRERAREALLAAAHRPVARRVALTLGEPLPASALRAALLEGDERERELALAQLRAHPDAALDASLLALLMRSDRGLAERRAALAALSHPSALPNLPRQLRARERTWDLEPLMPFGPGVAPRSLIEAGVCPSREQVLAFSAELRESLARRGETALLVHAGGASPDSLRSLDPRARRALLIELAARTELPPGAAEAIAAVRDVGDWPTRMWATRALGAVDPRESMSIVRALDVPPRSAECAAARAAN